jgi:hypothetical protein
MVTGIEPCVGAIDGVIEGQQVHGTEDTPQGSGEESPEVADAAAAESIDVGDQLYLIGSVDGNNSSVGGATICNRLFPDYFAMDRAIGKAPLVS